MGDSGETDPGFGFGYSLDSCARTGPGRTVESGACVDDPQELEVRDLAGREVSDDLDRDHVDLSGLHLDQFCIRLNQSHQLPPTHLDLGHHIHTAHRQDSHSAVPAHC